MVYASVLYKTEAYTSSTQISILKKGDTFQIMRNQ